MNDSKNNTVKTRISKDRSVQDPHATGSFYTDRTTADIMSMWMCDQNTKHVLEPSFGNGSFIKALKDVNKEIQITGVEINSDLCAVEKIPFLKDVHVINTDFHRVETFQVDGVIGNPPFVRLRNLSNTEREHIQLKVQAVLGNPMEEKGSNWMSVVLHSSQFLKKNGKMAFVLPFDATFVQYAKPFWKYLAQNFGHIRVVRVLERLFPDIQQQVILLFASAFGTSTDAIQLEMYESLIEYKKSIDTKQAKYKYINLTHFLDTERSFIRAILPQRLSELLDSISSKLTPMTNVCTWNIGYVSGNAPFFHPTQELCNQYGLSDSLHRNIAKAKQLREFGLYTSQEKDTEKTVLFYPNPHNLSEEEKNYIRYGEQNNVQNGYKCKNRSPWFLVPDVKRADVLLSGFSNFPKLVINDGNYLASNSLLVGTLSTEINIDQFVAGWYTNLTLLFCELHFRALGGGVQTPTPGETKEIQIFLPQVHTPQYTSRIDLALKAKDFQQVYNLGDQVLKEQLGFTVDDISILHQTLSLLRKWRIAK